MAIHHMNPNQPDTRQSTEAISTVAGPLDDPVVALLDAWLADDSGYDERVWPELKAALERDRLSERKRFRG